MVSIGDGWVERRRIFGCAAIPIQNKPDLVPGGHIQRASQGHVHRGVGNGGPPVRHRGPILVVPIQQGPNLPIIHQHFCQDAIAEKIPFGRPAKGIVGIKFPYLPRFQLLRFQRPRTRLVLSPSHPVEVHRLRRSGLRREVQEPRLTYPQWPRACILEADPLPNNRRPWIDYIAFRHFQAVAPQPQVELNFTTRQRPLFGVQELPAARGPLDLLPINDRDQFVRDHARHQQFPPTRLVPPGPRYELPVSQCECPLDFGGTQSPGVTFTNYVGVSAGEREHRRRKQNE